jgi:hypothetical protein
MISCTNFNAPLFERIDDNKLRVIGVSIGPHPEVSPGDTVTATAYFAGNPVVSVDAFSIAHSILWASDGTIPSDDYTITPINYISGLPDSIRFSFVVNSDVFIGRRNFSSLSQAKSDSVANIFIKNKTDLSTYLSGLPAKDLDSLKIFADKMVLPAFLLFTAHSASGTSLKIKTDFSIKYHVPDLGTASALSNPSIHWVGICKVPSQYALGFSLDSINLNNNHVITYLYNSDTPSLVDSIIDVDTGYSYFLAADNGVYSSIDSNSMTRSDTAWDTIIDRNGVSQYATYNYMWFYQNLEYNAENADTLMLIDNNESALVEMRPPRLTSIHRFRVCLCVYDQFPGIWNRPRGETVRMANGVFRYSDAYIKKYGE